MNRSETYRLTHTAECIKAAHELVQSSTLDRFNPVAVHVINVTGGMAANDCHLNALVSNQVNPDFKIKSGFSINEYDEMFYLFSHSMNEKNGTLIDFTDSQFNQIVFIECNAQMHELAETKFAFTKNDNKSRLCELLAELIKLEVLQSKGQDVKSEIIKTSKLFDAEYKLIERNAENET